MPWSGGYGSRAWLRAPFGTCDGDATDGVAANLSSRVTSSALTAPARVKVRPSAVAASSARLDKGSRKDHPGESAATEVLNEFWERASLDAARPFLPRALCAEGAVYESVV